jgi:SAM-dependent methyltransferase
MTSKDLFTNPLSEDRIAQRTEEAKAQLHDYICRIDNLWKRSALLQQKFPNSNDANFKKHIDIEAILYFRELQDCGVSFPTWQDMLTVGGETDLRLFLQIGRGCYEDIIKYLPKTKTNLRILDFGVGCGRTARHFYQEVKHFEIHGCDVDSTPIEFLYKNIPFIQPLLSTNEPPLLYKTEYFDAIYSVSVFSHLNESAFYAWANELSRIMKTGGVLIITIHGLHALNLTRNKEDVGSIGIDKKTFSTTESLFSQNGFIWMPQATTSADIDTTQYGISFVDKDRLTAHIPTSLKVVHYGEGEIGGWQDLVVLEKI